MFACFFFVFCFFCLEHGLLCFQRCLNSLPCIFMTFGVVVILYSSSTLDKCGSDRRQNLENITHPRDSDGSRFYLLGGLCSLSVAFLENLHSDLYQMLLKFL